jgi:hypothetical protein
MDEAQVAFEALKRYLSSPPLLTSRKPIETLLLYLASISTVVSATLVKEEYGHQHPIHYVRKALTRERDRYTQIEKISYALLMASRKLCPYFLGHAIIVPLTFPLKEVFGHKESMAKMPNG